VIAAQFGCAAGIFCWYRLPCRPLLVTLLGLTGLGLLATSLAP
jgi:hypothetical protein